VSISLVRIVLIVLQLKLTSSHNRAVSIHIYVTYFNSLQASGSADVARVPESVAEGTFVAHVVVTDPDEGRNGRFECTLSGDSSSAENSFRLMTVGEGEYQLLTAAMLDREEVDQYRLSVICEDGGQPALVSSAALLVQVAIGIIINIIVINVIILMMMTTTTKTTLY